jgi:hypothetical protein
LYPMPQRPEPFLHWTMAGMIERSGRRDRRGGKFQAVRVRDARNFVARPRPSHRLKRAVHSLMPPLRLTNWPSCSETSLHAAAYRITRLHLLRVRLSALAGSAVHRMTAANGPSRSEIANRCQRRARRARPTSNWDFLVERDHDFVLYCERNLVERSFNKNKHYRGIAARYGKLGRNFLAAVRLAAANILLD